MNVRGLGRGDLQRAADFCARARNADPAIEPFGGKLATLAGDPRALLDLWQVAEGENGAIEGIAFAALREVPSASAGRRAKADVYVAVAPRFRRQGVASALCAPALRWAARHRATLRARAPDGAVPGQSFLARLGFRITSAELLLTWSKRSIDAGAETSVRVKQLDPGEELLALEQLSRAAWAGEPDGLATDADELARLSRERGRLTLLAEAGGRAVGYLSGAWLNDTLGIDEVAAVPEWRRKGTGRALLSAALRDAANAVLWVSEANDAARALYRSFGFTPTSRRLVHELRHE